MRSRRLLSLSVIALAAIGLVGCATGGSSTDATGGADSKTADTVSLCDSAAASGAESNAVKVSGDVGSEAKISLDGELSITDLQRTVVTEGSGTKPAYGDWITYAYSAFNPETGELLQADGYKPALPAMQLAEGAQLNSYFGCAPAGSRVVVTVPATEQSSAVIFVLDVTKVTPKDKWCAVSDSNDAQPEVTFNDKGVPTIKITKGAKGPSEIEVKTLTQGNGAVVGEGDNVSVLYTGAKWSDGAVFDSNWESGEAASFKTTEVVTGFKRALEGQKVGSTVLVTMPPACGYGEGEIDASGQTLVGETLSFVVKIEASAKQ
ncbi:FKBP-type peptidyl-prolyl cis-trans isomerase [Microbacterium gorillae]|uniref:FKBP-type peptidyl-prolyl cis-trans isomerase n=1 Tax=Microbacterium gorillae TaxID=1231063 RepID=UPI00058B1C5A|nr:FKBP-type peptidyl-prolyl cis-trans isomerase [Microbacterium gorillae]